MTPICFNYFWNNSKNSPFYLFAVTFSVGLIYFLDRIFDAKKTVFERNERHFLAKHDSYFNSFVLLILLLCSVYFFKNLSQKEWFLITLMVFSSVLYFVFLKFFKLKFHKEIMSSFIIALGLCVFPQLLDNQFVLKIGLAFFLMVLINMMLLSVSDYQYDLKHQFHSFAIYFGPQKTKVLVYLLILLLFILTFYIDSNIYVWMKVYVMYYLILTRLTHLKNKMYLHFLADLIFLFPLFL